MVEFGKTKTGEPLHPGRILLTQAMEPLGISRNQLARDIDVPVGRISDITNGKRGITADTALRLGRYFGTGPELWMRLQAEFDLYVARITTWPSVEPRVRVLEAQPGDAPDTTAGRQEISAGDEDDVYADNPLAGDPAGEGPDEIAAEMTSTSDLSAEPVDRPGGTSMPRLQDADEGGPEGWKPEGAAPAGSERTVEENTEPPAFPEEEPVLGGNGTVGSRDSDHKCDDDGGEEELGIPPMPGQPAPVASS